MYCTVSLHDHIDGSLLHQDACIALLNELKMEVELGEHSLTAAENHGELSSSSMPSFILVIDGRTLDWVLQEDLKNNFLELSCRCKAVICCRSTPMQKSQVVRLIRDQLGVITLAVGKDTSCKNGQRFSTCCLFKCKMEKELKLIKIKY